MSKTIVSAAAQLLAVILPMLGVEVGTEQLTTTIQTIVIVVGSLVVWAERVKRGDVTIFGAKV